MLGSGLSGLGSVDIHRSYAECQQTLVICGVLTAACRRQAFVRAIEMLQRREAIQVAAFASKRSIYEAIGVAQTL
jgi:hypothetical protein